MNADIITPVIPDRSFCLTDFGGIGDGRHDNTNAFARAIEACTAAGGGTVIVPKGMWLTGSIKLTSKLRLHLEKGAYIQFSVDYEKYPLIQSAFEGRRTVRCQSPLDGESLEHVAITGDGIIDGAGHAWRPVKRDKLTASQWRNLIKEGGAVENERIWWPTESAMKGAETLARLSGQETVSIEDYEQIKVFLRPNLLSLRNSKYILLDGPVFQNSPAWCLHPWVCEHVTIRNVNVRNPWHSQNGDGLDVESCRYVLVEDSAFDVGDDAICMKSGKDEEGRQLGIPSEKIWIRNCVVYHGHGGFVIGSEMSGGVREVEVDNCTFIGTDVGLRFKSTRGRGGCVEKIRIRNIHMSRIAGEAILFDLFYGLSKEQSVRRDLPVTEETPQFTNIKIEHVICKGASAAVRLNGLPEMPVSHFELSHAVFETKEGIVCQNGKQMKLSHINMQNQSGPGIVLHQCKEVQMQKLNLDCNANECIQISGEESERIRWEDVTAAGAEPLAAIGKEVKSTAIQN